MSESPIEYLRLEGPAEAKWQMIRQAGIGGWALADVEEVADTSPGSGGRPTLLLHFSRPRPKSTRATAAARTVSFRSLLGLE